MDLILVGLLAFVPFLSLADGPAEIQTRACGLDRVGYVKSSNGSFVFVNEKKVEDEDLICESLDVYFGNGCLSGDEEWGTIRKNYCDGKFSSHTRANYGDLLQQAGRKLLHQALANISNHDLLSRNNQQNEKILTPAKLALAIPGFFLLSCALLCPCFHAKKKVPSEQNIMSTDILSESN